MLVQRQSTWWPIIEDPVGVAGDHSLHAVDMWKEPRNKDRRPPIVARCGVILWKVYGVGSVDQNGVQGTMVMPWPPKLKVAQDAYAGATICDECRALATPKRPLPSWSNLRSASSSDEQDARP